MVLGNKCHFDRKQVSIVVQDSYIGIIVVMNMALLIFLDDLSVQPGSVVIFSEQVWGAVRALETLSQLVIPDSTGQVSIIKDPSMK